MQHSSRRTSQQAETCAPAGGHLLRPRRLDWQGSFLGEAGHGCIVQQQCICPAPHRNRAWQAVGACWTAALLIRCANAVGHLAG